MKEKKYKHMTLEDRIEIQECLNKGINFKDIGKEKSDKLKELHFDSLVRRGVNRLKVKRSIGTKISISTV